MICVRNGGIELFLRFFLRRWQGDCEYQRCEKSGNPTLADLGVDEQAGPAQAGGNMEGKEVRFGIANSALWAAATTSASNGSVNSMHDSYTPLGGLVPLWLIQLGEVVFGGVGSGLYGMLAFAIIANLGELIMRKWKGLFGRS